MLLHKLVNLMELHEEYLKIHSRLVLDGEYEQAEKVQDKMEHIWKDIAKMIEE